MGKALPYVTVAVLCEKVLQEKDESLSIMRMVDKLQYRVDVSPGLPKDIKPIVYIQGLVSVKSGPATGEHVIRVVIERPKGDRKEIFSHPVKLLGGDQGQNIILNLGLGVEQDGLYWFDIVFDEDVLTRIPLMVIPLQEQTPQGKLPTT